MTTQTNEFIPTRLSLLSRLRDWNDQQSWQCFFDTYWQLIYTAARKAGLTDAEAQDVVQETIISTSKSLREGRYDSNQGSFKQWLMKLTRWRIADQFRRRLPAEDEEASKATSTGTGIVDRLPDPETLVGDTAWDEEWERNLYDAAVARVKRKVDPKSFQMFDLYVSKQWQPARIAQALKVQRARVYLTKHRIGILLKKEIRFLKAQPACGLDKAANDQ